VVALDGVPTLVWDDLVTYVSEHEGDRVSVTVERDGALLELQTTLQPHPDRDGGYIGISRSAFPRESENPIVGVPVTVREYAFLMKNTVFALGDFLRPSNLGSFVGSVFDTGDDATATPDAPTPGSGSGGSNGDSGRIVSLVGATRIGADLTENGFDGLLAFLVMINTFVGVFNLVPLLPLDGGHVAVATYEKLRSRRGVRYHVDVAKLLPLTYAVLAVLAIVGVSAIYLDIADPIQL
jgi:membrane-associated protease RseP (regulator of RpoE activity)